MRKSPSTSIPKSAAALRDSAKARYEYLLNRLRLKQAVGTLSDQDLMEVSKLME